MAHPSRFGEGWGDRRSPELDRGATKGPGRTVCIPPLPKSTARMGHPEFGRQDMVLVRTWCNDTALLLAEESIETVRKEDTRVLGSGGGNVGAAGDDFEDLGCAAAIGLGVVG